MKYDLVSTTLDKVKTDCLIVAIYEKNELSNAAKEIDKISQGHLTEILKQDDIQGKIGQSLLLYVPKLASSRVILIGCGKRDELTDSKLIKIFQQAMTDVLKTSSKQVVNTLTEIPLKNRDMSWLLRQAVMVSEDLLYRFDDMKIMIAEAIISWLDENKSCVLTVK